jgi:hypothetical protein
MDEKNKNKSKNKSKKSTTQNKNKRTYIKRQYMYPDCVCKIYRGKFIVQFD